MTGFNLDFNDTFEGGIKDGTYEVVFTKMAEDATQGGTEYVDVRLTIRNDIQQDHKNQIVFHKIWKAKATGKYYMPAFNTMGKATQLNPGKTYKSLEELFNDFLGKAVKVTVKNETSEYNGKTYENLNVKRWDKSGFPEVAHKFKAEDAPKQSNPFANQDGPVDIKDSDLPF